MAYKISSTVLTSLLKHPKVNHRFLLNTAPKNITTSFRNGSYYPVNDILFGLNEDQQQVMHSNDAKSCVVIEI